MKILDKDISFNNYAKFKDCKILNDGKVLLFTMACGDSYKVHLNYMLKWFSKPHYHHSDGELQKWEDGFYKSEPAHIINCNSVLENGAIRIFLSNNSVYDVAWDTVLMACEEKYEHFGGLTEESKKIVKEWHQKNKLYSGMNKNEVLPTTSF